MILPDLSLHFDYFEKYGILKRDPYVHHDASDLHVSRIIETIVGHDIKRVERTGNFLLWNGYCWEERDNLTPVLDKLADTVRRHINDIHRHKNQEPKSFYAAFAEWKRLDPTDEKKLTENLGFMIDIEEAIYKKLSTANSRTQLIGMVCNRRTVRPEDLDANTDQLVFKNGCYNCQTGKFIPNDRDQNATLAIRWDYKEPDEQSVKTWSDYLKSLEFDEETLNYLQRSFGYAATGRGSEKRFWWFRGETGTSKTTLIELVAKCLDQYRATTLSDQWVDKKAMAGGHTEELARLRGKRMVTADEFKKNSRFNESLLKKMTAGTGDISASRKSEKTIEFSITFALYFNSNFDCHLTEDDHAFIKRLNTVTFTKKIDPDSVDEKFVDKFLARGQNRMAVLKWVMEGARMYCESGIGKDPAHIQTSREALIEGQMSINEQLEEILELNTAATGKKAVTLNNVLEALSSLQKSTRQYNSFTKNEISKAITSLFNIELTKANGHSGFVGLSLKNSHTPKQRRNFDPMLDWNGDDYEDLTNRASN